MSFDHLPIEQGEDLKRLIELLRQKAEVLVSKIDAYNNVAAIFVEAIDKAVEEYALVARNAEDFRHVIHKLMTEHWAVQPPRWQKSKEGKIYKLWMMEWGTPIGGSPIGTPALVKLPALNEAERLASLRHDP